MNDHHQVGGETNSLCGMAALYQAMDDTLMTKSQLRAASYDDMREAITKEMLMTNSATKTWSDADLLRHFYDCEYDLQSLKYDLYLTGVCTDNKWRKVFSHDVAGGPFASAEETELSNPLDDDADRFSIMAKLPQFQHSNGRWHFKICYPELASVHPFPCNQWSQTRRPHAGVATNVVKQNTTFKYRVAQWSLFSGLSLSRTGADLSVIKGARSRVERWFTIGALLLENGKIPGPVDTLVSKVELFAMREDRLATATAGRKKREITSTRKLVKREESGTPAPEPESEESIAQRSYGSRLRYQCGPARRFFSPDNESYYDDMWLECNWNKSWTPVDSLDSCNWVQCLNPPDPPEEHLLELDWDGLPVEFNSTVSYVCQSDDTYFLWDNTQLEFNVTCLNGGSWDDPDEWPICVECKHRLRIVCFM